MLKDSMHKDIKAVLITEEDTQKHKPYPDPYLLALVKFDADKSRTLIIEDSINNHIFAKNGEYVSTKSIYNHS